MSVDDVFRGRGGGSDVNRITGRLWPISSIAPLLCRTQLNESSKRDILRERERALRQIPCSSLS